MQRKRASGPTPAGSAEQIRFGLGQTSIAALLVAVGSAGLVAIIVREHPDADARIAGLERRFPDARLVRDDAGTRAEMAAVIRFVEAPTANIDLPLDIRGTDFQRRVYREVLAISFGQTRTFADIAAQIGAPKAVRAVGNACSNNPFEFAIRATGCFAVTAPGRAAVRGAIGANAPSSPASRIAEPSTICRQRQMSRAAGAKACRAILTVAEEIKAGSSRRDAARPTTFR